MAIEIFDRIDDRRGIRIDINGAVWARIDPAELPDRLAEIGRAYVDGRLASLLREPPAGT